MDFFVSARSLERMVKGQTPEVAVRILTERGHIDLDIATEHCYTYLACGKVENLSTRKIAFIREMTKAKDKEKIMLKTFYFWLA